MKKQPIMVAFSQRRSEHHPMKINEKQQISLFRLCLISTIILSLLCVGTLVFGIMLRNAAYDSFTTISTATDHAQKTTQYIRAIQLRPSLPDAYIKLLEAYAEDGKLTKQESQTFLSLYNANRTALDRDDEGYVELHYRAGLLYINGYEDLNPTTRLRMAIPFFENAVSAKNEKTAGLEMVQIYCRMGQYYRDYIWDVSAGMREVPQSEIIAMVNEIQEALAALKSAATPDALYNRLGFSLAVCNLLFEQRDVFAATVPYDAVNAILDAVYEDLPDPETLQKEQLRFMLNDLQKNEETYRAMLDRAYERKEGNTA